MIYLEEEILTHRKFIIAGSMIENGGVFAALGLYVAGIGYAREHLTNGRIDDEFLGTFPAKSRAVLVARVLSSRRVRLWHRVKGGYRIHDFHDHNETADKIKHKRELARKRKAAERARKAVTAIPNVTHHVTPLVTVTVTRDPARARSTPTVRTYDPSYLSTCTNHKKNPRTARTTRDTVEILKWRRAKSKGTDGVGHPKVATLAALARHVLAEHPDEHDDGELIELTKRAAARVNLQYDGRTVAVALTNARQVAARIAQRRPA